MNNKTFLKIASKFLKRNKYSASFIALGVLVPSALLFAQSAFSSPNASVQVNCVVEGSCPFLVGSSAILNGQPSSELRFGAVTGTQYSTLGTQTTASGTLLLVGNGTQFDFFGSATTSINPDVLGPLAATSSVFTLTGARANDTVAVALPALWQQTTSSVMVRGYVSSDDTVTVRFISTAPTTTVDLVTATPAFTVFSTPN